MERLVKPILKKLYEKVSNENSWSEKWTSGLNVTMKLGVSRRMGNNSTVIYNLTFRGPCVVIYSYNKSQRDALFLTFI
jgi:hypothetical protein